MGNLFLDPLLAIGGFKEAYDFYQLDRKEKLVKVKEQIQENPKAAVVAVAVGAAMINPATRVAMCGLLGMAYSMTMMTLQLVVLGLSIAMYGTKGFASAANFLKGCASEFAGGLNETSQAQKPKEEPSSVKVEEVKEEPKKETASTANQSSKVEEQVKEFEELQKDSSKSSSNNSNQETLPSKTADILDNDFDDAWEQKNTSLPPQTEAVFEQAFQETSQKLPVRDEMDELLDEWIESEKPKAPSSFTQASTDQLVEQFAEMNKPNSAEMMIQQFDQQQRMGIPMLQPENLVKEFKGFQQVEGLVKEFRGFQAEKWVQEFSADQMANEFVKQGANSNLLKPIAVGVGAGVAVFAIYQAYKALTQETEEEDVQDTSYANVSQMPESDQETQEQVKGTSSFLENIWG